MNTNADLLHATHLGDENEKYLNAVVPPIFMNSLHVYPTMEEYNDAKFFYGRYANPTVEIVETKIAAMENGGRALLFASGMGAASTAIVHATKAQSHIICQKSCYNPVKQFINNICIPKYNMSVTYVDGTDLAEIENAIQDNTDLLIMESPSTFILDIIDIRALVTLAKKHNIKTYIDNTYCTPLHQKPLDMGVDYVMHTSSKYLGGHSDIIGGVLVVKDFELGEQLRQTNRALYGTIMGPMEAWLVLRGIRTLHARLEMHAAAGMAVASYLQGHPKVKKVYYPGLTSHSRYELGQAQMSGNNGLMSLELDASVGDSVKFINALKLFGKGCSWGGFESLAIMPLMKSTDEEAAMFKCSKGLIRLHCGLEGTSNLIADIDQALALL